MKKSIICFCAIMIVAVSCTKSRFSTTSRHYRDGKVVYTNHYSREKTYLKRPEARPEASLIPVEPVKKPGIQADEQAEGNRINFTAASDHCLPEFSRTEKRSGLKNPTTDPQLRDEKGVTISKPAGKVLKPDPFLKSVTKVFRGSDTTVKTVKSKDIPAGTVPPKGPKTEKLGLVGFFLSFLGIIPVVGIPFGILGIVFGAVSLRKIIRNPSKYKGKGFAIAGMVIGSTMLVINVLMLVAAVNAAENTTVPSVNSSSTSCRV